jgi:hypothetical protein
MKTSNCIVERLSTMKVKYFFAGESYVHSIEVIG